jgi:hypothetical protein
MIEHLKLDYDEENAESSRNFTVNSIYVVIELVLIQIKLRTIWI